MKTIRRVCAWCNKELGRKEVPRSGGDITHGICSPCLIKATNFEDRTATQILNFIQEPVFIVDSNVTIKAANVSGQKLLGKSFDQIENAIGGDALECSYASMKEGCGKTEHCKTCAIRNILLDTLDTGQGYMNVPAFQNIKTDTCTRSRRDMPWAAHRVSNLSRCAA